MAILKVIGIVALIILAVAVISALGGHLPGHEQIGQH